MTVKISVIHLDYFDSRTGDFIGTHSPISNSMSEEDMVKDTEQRHKNGELINLSKKKNVIVMVQVLGLPRADPYLLIPKGDE